MFWVRMGFGFTPSGELSEAKRRVPWLKAMSKRVRIVVLSFAAGVVLLAAALAVLVNPPRKAPFAFLNGAEFLGESTLIYEPATSGSSGIMMMSKPLARWTVGKVQDS